MYNTNQKIRFIVTLSAKLDSVDALYIFGYSYHLLIPLLSS